jgi:hypothetical protein
MLLRAFHCRQGVYNINEVLKWIFYVRNCEIEHTKLLGCIISLTKHGIQCRLDA